MFSTHMVKAILEGRKTQTRRILTQTNSLIDGYTWSKHQCNFNDMDWEDIVIDGGSISFAPERYLKVAYPLELTRHRVYSKIEIGDVLWCRETWQHTKCLNLNWEDDNYGHVYRADGQPWEDYDGWVWKPSIFMPKEACRLFLKVTNVRVERLKDISEEDANAEGISGIYNSKQKNHIDCWLDYTHGHRGFSSPIKSFFSLWESINGKESLEANPWLWVYDFQITERPDNFNL